MSFGDVIEGEKTYDLHAGQMDVMRAENRFVAAIAGTGGGKTAIGPLWLMNEIALTCAKRDVWRDPLVMFVVAPTYDILARATAPTFVKAFAGTDLEGEYVPSRRQYHLPRGLGVVWLLSADRPGGLEGGQIDGAWIDEGGQLKYDAWIAIRGRLGLRRGRCLITTTPYTRNWLFHRFVQVWRAGDPDYYVRQWSSVNNPAYPEEEYEAARRDMTPQRFAMRYDGDFVKLEGLVYPDFDSCVRPFDPPQDVEQIIGGVDFGWNDPFAALVAAKTRDDVLYVFRERYVRCVHVEEHARKLDQRGEYGADPSRPDLIHKMRLCGLHVVGNRTKSILHGVDLVNKRIYNGTLIIHPRCTATTTEAEEYSYSGSDEATGGEKPVDGFDHAMDALRYMVCLVDGKQVKEAA